MTGVRATCAAQSHSACNRPHAEIAACHCLNQQHNTRQTHLTSQGDHLPYLALGALSSRDARSTRCPKARRCWTGVCPPTEPRLHAAGTVLGKQALANTIRPFDAPSAADTRSTVVGGPDRVQNQNLIVLEIKTNKQIKQPHEKATCNRFCSRGTRTV
jgi:hypothetical protein